MIRLQCAIYIVFREFCFLQGTYFKRDHVCMFILFREYFQVLELLTRHNLNAFFPQLMKRNIKKFQRYTCEKVAASCIKANIMVVILCK